MGVMPWLLERKHEYLTENKQHTRNIFQQNTSTLSAFPFSTLQPRSPTLRIQDHFRPLTKLGKDAIRRGAESGMLFVEKIERCIAGAVSHFTGLDL
jgi:hypothetical protein